MDNNKKKIKKVALYILVIIMLIASAVAGFYLYKALVGPKDIVTDVPQTVVETTQGAKITANKAGYNIDDGQAKEVAKVIREIRTENKEPLYVVNTNGKEVKQQTEQAKKDNKADFAIVTDRNNPDKAVDLNKIDKDTKVELNQYNVQAYKPVIRTISVTPDFGDNNIRQVGFSIAKKVTKDGQYLGIGTGYDFKDKRVLVSLTYSW